MTFNLKNKSKEQAYPLSFYHKQKKMLQNTTISHKLK